MRTSFTLTVPRWWRSQMLSAMHTTAANYGVELSYQIFGGVISLNISCTIEGPEDSINDYIRWIRGVVAANS